MYHSITRALSAESDARQSIGSYFLFVSMQAWKTGLAQHKNRDVVGSVYKLGGSLLLCWLSETIELAIDVDKTRQDNL